MTGYGAGWLDHSNDADPGLFVANDEVKLEAARAGKSDNTFGQINQMMRNPRAVAGLNTFIEVGHPASEVFAVQKISRGVAPGELDNDGAVDILLTNTNGPARIYNQLISSHIRCAAGLRAGESDD